MAELNAKQKLFLDYVWDAFPNITDETYKEAKEFAGYAESYSVWQIVNGLKEEILAGMKQRQAMYGVEALAKQVHLMRNPEDKWWRAKLAITDSILDRAGMAKKPDGETSAMPSGVIILPGKKYVISEEA
jgi:hypothetical protein